MKSSTSTMSFRIASSDAFVCKWSRKMVAIFTRYFVKGRSSKARSDLGICINSFSISGTSRCRSSGDGSTSDGASNFTTERNILISARTNKKYMDYTSSYSHVKHTYKRILHWLKTCALQGYYAGSSGNFLQRNYHYSLHSSIYFAAQASNRALYTGLSLILMESIAFSSLFL